MAKAANQDDDQRRPLAARKRSRSLKTSAKKQIENKGKPEEARLVERLKKTVGFNHQTWTKTHPQCTLTDLLKYLQQVRDVICCFNKDDLIVDLIRDREEASEYLSNFIAVDDLHDHDSLDVFVFGLIDEIKCDILCLILLMSMVGKTFPVKQLPMRENKLRRVLQDSNGTTSAISVSSRNEIPSGLPSVPTTQ